MALERLQGLVHRFWFASPLAFEDWTKPTANEMNANPTNNPHGLIWRNADGSPISAKQDAQDWRDLLHAAGIIGADELAPGGTRLTGHWARHTTVTVLASLGVDFQLIGEIVGHSSAEVTRIYRHAQGTERMAAMEKLGAAFALALPAQIEG